MTREDPAEETVVSKASSLAMSTTRIDMAEAGAADRLWATRDDPRKEAVDENARTDERERTERRTARRLRLRLRLRRAIVAIEFGLWEL